LLLLGLTIALGGCQTTSSTVTNTRSQCAAWRAISYSASKDTGMTVRQIRIHNRVGQRLGCWK
jgi:hypothetical protein